MLPCSVLSGCKPQPAGCLIYSLISAHIRQAWSDSSLESEGMRFLKKMHDAGSSSLFLYTPINQTPLCLLFSAPSHILKPGWSSLSVITKGGTIELQAEMSTLQTKISISSESAVSDGVQEKFYEYFFPALYSPKCHQIPSLFQNVTSLSFHF